MRVVIIFVNQRENSEREEKFFFFNIVAVCIFFFLRRLRSNIEVYYMTINNIVNDIFSSHPHDFYEEKSAEREEIFSNVEFPSKMNNKR
jgi:hypothetical protein